MKHIFQARTLIEASEVQMFRDLLEEAGIPSLVRNENLAVAMGDIPYTECYPELWALRDADAARARELVAAYRAARLVERSPWTCPGCGESIEGQFTSCWQCGSEPAVPGASIPGPASEAADDKPAA